ncbi:uncharacterized protein LOC127258305 [Andrographis paniculata]|uniref:uncharacterized protein LOC127258305 n=1 Tax=Andrographis paniculata TaxID=175694 RepID=UPI0021E70CA1|nr:uncharacterized protein LOC127258305 [Andrographis paniculata]
MDVENESSSSRLSDAGGKGKDNLPAAGDDQPMGEELSNVEQDEDRNVVRRATRWDVGGGAPLPKKRRTSRWDVVGDPPVPEFINPAENVREAGPPHLEMDPSTWRRHLPTNLICVKKTLTANDVISVGASLRLTESDAVALTGVDDPNASSFTWFKPMPVVFDSNDTQYDMVMMRRLGNDGSSSYSITTGWDSFLEHNRLRAGDEINFYKTVDERVSDQPYLVIKYFRRPRSPVRRPRPRIRLLQRSR